MNPSNPEDSIVLTESTHPYSEVIAELLEQANHAQETGQLEAAITNYQKIINIEPEFILAYQKIGYLSLQVGKFEQAITAYQKVIELNPSNFWAYNNLGEALIKLNRWEEGIPIYQKAIELNPDFFWAYNSLGECLTELKRWEEAIPIYEKALKLDPNYWGAYLKLGEAFLNLERWEDMVPLYRRSIELQPDFFWSYINLGQALIRLERWEEAVPVCQQAIAIDPNFFWSYINLGDSFYNLKRWEEAVQAYTEANQIQSDFFWSYKNLGDALIHLEKWKEVIPVSRRAIEINPKADDCYYNLGLAYLNLNQKEDAIACFEKVLELQPDFTPAQDKLQELKPQPINQNSTQPLSRPLEPIDWLKYYPKSAQAPAYVIPKVAPSTKNPHTGKWQFPIPPQELMLVFDFNEDYYISSGKAQIQILLSTLRDCGYFIKTGSRILDFGCASGRMLRELADLTDICEIWGTDINADCMAWCQQNMSPPFHFFTGTTAPHLPFEDRYFDLIYAGSVFTHIDDLAEAWLLELRRILKPGGLAYITIQERHLFEKIKENPALWLSNNNIWFEDQKEACIQSYFEYTQQDFAKFTLGRDTRSLVFYDLDYFCHQWKPFFQTLAIKKEAYYWQTGVLLKRI